MAVGKVRTGVILIAIGVLLLLNTTGIVDFGFWHWIGRLWPVILIAIGLEKIFASSTSSSMRNLAWLSPLLIVGVVTYAVVAGEREQDTWGEGWNWHWDGPQGDESSMSTSTWSETFSSDAKRMAVTLGLNSGRLTVRGGADSGNSLVVRASSYAGKPNTESTVSDGLQTIKVIQRRRMVDDHGRDQWTVKLTDSIPVDLTIDGGATKMRLDFTAVKVESLDLEAGAADISVVFGTLVPSVMCTLDCGAADMDFTIPRNAGLRLRQRSVVQSTSESDFDLVDRGEYRETADYESAPVKIDLSLDAAVSSLRLRRASAVSGESI